MEAPRVEQGHIGTRPLFAFAATSLAQSEVGETLVAALHARLFRPYAEGLRQYLAIRLGSVAEAEALLGELRTRVTGTTAPELTAEPGARARLYRMAREVAAAGVERLGAPSRAALEALPWRPPGPATAPGYGAVLARLRAELDRDSAELIELAFARGLGSAELAHVLGRPAADLDRDLERALTAARSIVGEAGLAVADLGAVLLEAFALEWSGEVPAAAAPPVAEAIPPGTVIGTRYSLDERVGAGAFGDVYRASDTEVPGHVVAVKLLRQPAISEEARAAVMRELHLIASVFHPSVVQLKDHGWHEGRLWFVTPWYEGETLESRIRRSPLTRDEAQGIFVRLARALATMHEAGIRHQDIKPDNVFLARIRGYGHGEDEALLPVLLDLGVAAKEAEMVLAGTPTYFAPEVAAGFARMEGAPITAKADVFSLALSLRNALEPESQEDVPAGAVERFIEHRARHAPGPPLGKELAFLRPNFERWLAFDPDERPTADELAAELSVLTRPEKVAARRARVVRWAVPLGIAFLAVLGAVVFGLSREARIQALEAERARTAAAAALEDRDRAEERSRALEKAVAGARKRIESSALTRQQLATELAGMEGERNVLRDELDLERQRGLALRGRLGEAEAEAEQLGSELGATRSSLESERLRAGDLEKTLASAREDLAAAAARAETAEERAEELGASLESARSESAASRSEAEAATRRAGESEAALAAARGEVAAARSEVADLERRVADLERRLAAAEAARRRPPATVPPSGPAGTPPATVPTPPTAPPGLSPPSPRPPTSRPPTGRGAATKRTIPAVRPDQVERSGD